MIIKVIRNLYKSFKLLIKTLLTGGVLKANKNKQKERINICNECDLIQKNAKFIFFKTIRCGECGCYIKEKVKYEFEECDNKKW